jgi:alanine racemase
MNSMLLDLSQLHNVKPGDMVELLGPNIKLEEVADQNSTISREILYRLGSIYNRVYTDFYI